MRLGDGSPWKSGTLDPQLDPLLGEIDSKLRTLSAEFVRFSASYQNYTTSTASTQDPLPRMPLLRVESVSELLRELQPLVSQARDVIRRRAEGAKKSGEKRHRDYASWASDVLDAAEKLRKQHRRTTEIWAILAERFNVSERTVRRALQRQNKTPPPRSPA